mgnify:CR=1 FL=1
MTTKMYGFRATHPGEVLKEEIEYRRISQKELAAQMGMSYNILNDILNGRRSITESTAMLFEAALDIFPTGSYALHALGLSTQVPANAVFITNGSPRKINIGRKKDILFKHSDNAHNFEYKSKEMQLVVAALKEIGKGLATEEELTIIKEIVDRVPENQFKHDLAIAPNWIIKLIKTL